MKKGNISVFLVFIFLNTPLPISHGQTPLVMDGIISDGEWEDSYSKIVRMSSGFDIELQTQYTETDVYFLITFSHDSPGDEIIRDPAAGRHDYFGIEFDRNNDGVIMGTEESPDDMVLIDYIESGAIDMYSHSFTVFEDGKSGGTSDVEGKSNDIDGTLIYEFRKSLKSTDTNGFDISLKTGDKFYIMPAIWDDRPIHSTTSTVNVQIGNRLFLEMIVGEPVDSTNLNTTILLVVVLASGIYILFIYLKSRSTLN